MSNEKPEKMEEDTFPGAGLKEWAEECYSDETDKYAQELKQAHIKAVEERNIEGLKRLSRVMFVQLSRLRTESPEKWQARQALYDELTKWLEENGGL